jgi:NAD(P)-dependent dehydrogenase (short-subunit alcohol dehydrogenase family)
MRVDMSGKVALVTGAARGIGRAIADRLAREGASVVYSDLDGEGAKAASDAAGATFGGAHMALRLDVTSEPEIEAAVAAVLARHGRLDVLVNNAGIGTGPEERAEIDQVTTAQWERVLKVDLTGVFLVSRAAVKPMIAQRSGRVINIASVVGLVPLRLQSAYVAAKAGVANLTRSMALELARHNILVNAIAPGSTETDAWKGWIEDSSSEQKALYTRLISHIPLGRAARPEEIAHAALFLAAPASSYITGHVLTVDGGWIAGYARDF